MILSGNSLEHLLVSLGAYAARTPVMPISVAYSLMSSDHARIKAIAELTEPGPGVRRRRRAVRRRPRRARATVHRRRSSPGANGRARYVSRKLWEPALTGTVRSMATRSGRRSPNSYSHQDRPAPPRASSTPTGCCAPTRRCSRRSGRSWPTSRRCSSTGCRGATRSAATTTSTSRCSTAARSTSTTAGRRRRCSRSTLAALNAVAADAVLQRARRIRAAGARARERRRARRSGSSAAFGSCSTPPPRCPTRSPRGCASWPRNHADHEVPLTSSWGTTETARPPPPARTSSNSPTGCIGVPIPGVHVKLAPVGDKLEIRVNGPNVTPGYFRRPELTEAAVRRGRLLPLGRRRHADRRSRTRGCCSTGGSPRTSSC